MTEYLVRFHYLDAVYEMTIRTSSSGSAIKLVEASYPGSSRVTVVESR